MPRPPRGVLAGAVGDTHQTSITGTSTRTPTTVARAAPDWSPNSAMAVATASSKKLLQPSLPGWAMVTLEAAAEGRGFHLESLSARLSAMGNRPERRAALC